MRRSLIALTCVASILFSSCSNFVAVNNKIYQDAYGNVTPAVNNTFYLGNPTHYFNSTYTYSFYTYAWDDVSVPMANAKTPAANAPTWRYLQGGEVPAFSASQVNVIYFSAQLPHSYKEGSNLEFHIHVAYPDALAGNSTWYISYSWANIGDVFPLPAIVTVNDVPSPEIANAHRTVELVANINGAGKKISSILICSIQRLGNTLEDNYPSEIYLISSDFHIVKDTIGSRTESVK